MVFMRVLFFLFRTLHFVEGIIVMGPLFYTFLYAFIWDWWHRHGYSFPPSSFLAILDDVEGAKRWLDIVYNSSFYYWGDLWGFHRDMVCSETSRLDN